METADKNKRSLWPSTFSDPILKIPTNELNTPRAQLPVRPSGEPANNEIRPNELYNSGLGPPMPPSIFSSVAPCATSKPSPKLAFRQNELYNRALGPPVPPSTKTSVPPCATAESHPKLAFRQNELNNPRAPNLSPNAKFPSPLCPPPTSTFPRRWSLESAVQLPKPTRALSQRSATPPTIPQYTPDQAPSNAGPGTIENN